MADYELKISDIKTFLETHNLRYVNIDNYDDCIHIHKLLIDKLFTENDNAIVNYYYGLYYEINHNYDSMVPCYLKAIESNNVDAMYNLGNYHNYISKNYEEMEKYYLMAIGLDNVDAAYMLGYYYGIIKIYELMEQYYNIAIKLGSVLAMRNMGDHYESLGDYEKMLPYYLKAVALNDSTSMVSLAEYYKINKDIENMKKYYLMAHECGNVSATNDIIKICKEKHDIELFVNTYNSKVKLDNLKAIEMIVHFFDSNMKITPELIFVIIDIDISNYTKNVNHFFVAYKTKLQENIDIIDKHFSFLPGGQGAIDAKEHFKSGL